MYKLTFSPASPYVRKVMLAAFRSGLDKQLELLTDDKDIRSKSFRENTNS